MYISKPAYARTKMHVLYSFRLVDINIKTSNKIKDFSYIAMFCGQRICLVGKCCKKDVVDVVRKSFLLRIPLCNCISYVFQPPTVVKVAED